VGDSQGSGGDEAQPRFVHNDSGRFESRFLSVKIEESPSIMLKDMGEPHSLWSGVRIGNPCPLTSSFLL
jgi:phosphoribosylformylglycinamidine synthase